MFKFYQVFSGAHVKISFYQVFSGVHVKFRFYQIFGVLKNPTKILIELIHYMNPH
jgi:hypothetical protein